MDTNNSEKNPTVDCVFLGRAENILPEQIPIYVTLDEVAQILRLSRTSINRLVRQGRLRSFKNSKARSAHRLIAKADLEKFCQEGTRDGK